MSSDTVGAEEADTTEAASLELFALATQDAKGATLLHNVAWLEATCRNAARYAEALALINPIPPSRALGLLSREFVSG